MSGESIEQLEGARFEIAGDALKAIGELAVLLDTSYEESIRHALGTGLFLARLPEETQVLVNRSDGSLHEILRD